MDGRCGALLPLLLRVLLLLFAVLLALVSSVCGCLWQLGCIRGATAGHERQLWCLLLLLLTVLLLVNCILLDLTGARQTREFNQIESLCNETCRDVNEL
jgi:hypothetical protein